MSSVIINAILVNDLIYIYMYDISTWCRLLMSEELYMLVFSSWITFFCNSIFWALQTAILSNTLYHLLITYTFIAGTHTHRHTHMQTVNESYPVHILFLCYVYFTHRESYHTWTHMLKSVRLRHYNATLNAHHTLHFWMPDRPQEVK